LSKRDTGKTLYILDEPTTGLHFEDIRILMDVVRRLVDRGNTVIIIEHNMDVIRQADYIIDMGPEGGDLGGQVVAQGTPEQVALVKESYTGQFLKEILEEEKADRKIGTSD
ncbi:MAG: excinuclease ABC subunit UvrA, partial [Clostridia bacterium]|nr:excinuclease ABC subunit UvrA [Clostridia bacterium]